ncbi:DUF664 domain-containing protein [Spirosoma sp. KNUC1025]|uniref:mycothiol transferase n=1 Tax=Spirosoma sp. KNUC1025 TaxID=2894082 RepID=UPI0038655534|nr:DUF664 domain-containing protein [Spirosoma sp. KNUC1025]
MTSLTKAVSRRQFMNRGLATTACRALPNFLPQSAMAFGASLKNNLMVIGPIESYSPQIGTLVSMLNYNRDTIIHSVKNLTREQLDFLFAPHANTLGGLLLHLAAVDKYYQIN